MQGQADLQADRQRRGGREIGCRNKEKTKATKSEEKLHRQSPRSENQTPQRVKR